MSLAGLSLTAVESLVRELGEPPYRAKQIFRWVQARRAKTVDEMTDLPKALRGKLADRMPVRETSVVDEHDSGDGTRKLLIQLADGERVECVLIPEEPRATFCISSQVGCGVGCVFCASGADGVIRNLETHEILEQVFWLCDLIGDRPTNIVMMGMGEPLHNVDALVPALRLMQSPDGIDLGARRITVSTAGPTRGFEEFLASGLRVKLAISLHAVDDGLRRRLVPRGGCGKVADLADMAQRWFEKTGRDVTFEYVLIDGINDRDEDAARLARLAGRNRNINVIPMNSVPFAPDLSAPPAERIERFCEILRRSGSVVHARRQRGDDVAAACGQLRLSHK